MLHVIIYNVTTVYILVAVGYNLGMSSLIEAILKNQFLQVSFPDSGT